LASQYWSIKRSRFKLACQIDQTATINASKVSNHVLAQNFIWDFRSSSQTQSLTSLYVSVYQVEFQASPFTYDLTGFRSA